MLPDPFSELSVLETAQRQPLNKRYNIGAIHTFPEINEPWNRRD